MNKQQCLYYAITLLGYFGIMLLLLIWYGWLSPPKLLQPGIVIVLLTLPLFTALRGLLHARKYTITWSLFLALFYMSHGMVEAWSMDHARWLPLTEIALSLCWLSGGILFVRASRHTDTSA